MYEGTGLQGRSSLRKVDKETGRVIRQLEINSRYFGEGIAIFNDKIYQLTWQDHVGLVYDKATWEEVRRWTYAWQGWGITQDGTYLIVSDGTDVLHFLNPDTCSEARRVSVRDNGRPISQLNELEYIDGEIYANVWQTNNIAIIDPETGTVKAWIDLTGLLSPEDRGNRFVDVLNGIAFDKEDRKLYVTGKLWPKLYHIDLVPKGKKKRS